MTQPLPERIEAAREELIHRVEALAHDPYTAREDTAPVGLGVAVGGLSVLQGAYAGDRPDPRDRELQPAVDEAERIMEPRA